VGFIEPNDGKWWVVGWGAEKDSIFLESGRMEMAMSVLKVAWNVLKFSRSLGECVNLGFCWNVSSRSLVVAVGEKLFQASSCSLLMMTVRVVVGIVVIVTSGALVIG
jgi:hypothetical protein